MEEYSFGGLCPGKYGTTIRPEFVKVKAQNRFGKFVELIENDELFKSDKEERWICLNCGYIYTSKQAIENCPVCEHGKGYQIRHDWVLI